MDGDAGLKRVWVVADVTTDSRLGTPTYIWADQESTAEQAAQFYVDALNLSTKFQSRRLMVFPSEAVNIIDVDPRIHIQPVNWNPADGHP